MRCSVKLISIKIPPSGLHLIVNARINKKPARLVVDTGASQTVLDYNRIGRFSSVTEFEIHDGHSSGIGSSKMVSHIFHADSFSLGKCLLENHELVLIDMVHVNASYQLLNKKPVDGVLGGDILKKLDAIIDYRKRVLILRQ